MSDRVTANLPSRDLEKTAAFYETIGFTVGYKGEEWMIVTRGPLEIEFFPLDHDPSKSCFSACIRVDELDELYAGFQKAGLTANCWSIPRLSSPEVQHGLRMFILVDPDGNLLRCIDNRWNT